MRVPSRYLGTFHHKLDSMTVVLRADSNPAYVQYQYNSGSYWNCIAFKDWYYQVDDGTWIPDVPEYMQVSEGL